MDNLRQLAAATPFFDTHSHTVAPSDGRNAPGLAERLVNLACRPTFLSAGMDPGLLSRIASGRADPDEARRAVLAFLPYVETTSALRATIRGAFLCAGLDGDRITGENYDALERALASPSALSRAQYAKRFNIGRVALNLNSAQGAELICRGDEPPEKNDPFALIPTFDAHALDPRSAPVKKYARFLGCSLGTLSEYYSFIEMLLDCFISRCGVCGLKVSEQYFRRLDYAKSDRGEAERLYLSGENGVEDKALADDIANFILGLAERRGLTVQLHTGMLWGEPDVSSVHPSDLCAAIKRFPGVKFDLLHLGFPHLGEAAAIALNAPNAYLNLSWLPLISEKLAEDWLVRLLQMVPLNKITFGTDVFDVETLCGAVEMIRDIVARAAARFPGREKEVIRRLLWENADVLYKIRNQRDQASRNAVAI